MTTLRISFSFPDSSNLWLESCFNQMTWLVWGRETCRMQRVVHQVLQNDCVWMDLSFLGKRHLLSSLPYIFKYEDWLFLLVPIFWLERFLFVVASSRGTHSSLALLSLLFSWLFWCLSIATCRPSYHSHWLEKKKGDILAQVDESGQFARDSRNSSFGLQKCKKIRGLGCVNQACSRTRVAQPS